MYCPQAMMICHWSEYGGELGLIADVGGDGEVGRVGLCGRLYPHGLGLGDLDVEIDLVAGIEGPGGLVGPAPQPPTNPNTALQPMPHSRHSWKPQSLRRNARSTYTTPRDTTAGRL